MNSSLRSERVNVAEFKLETLLTECEYAQITKRSVASIRRDRLLRQGCPYVKLGALVRYRPEDVRAHLESSLCRPGSNLAQPGAIDQIQVPLDELGKGVLRLLAGELSEQVQIVLRRHS